MTHTSLRLSDEDKQLIEKLAKHFGVSEAGVIRMIVRKTAREEGITIDQDTENRSASNTVQH